MENKRKETLALGAILTVALVLRVASAQGDLWIDEVWSLYNLDIARSLSSWHDKLGLFFHDNTHPINTIYLFLVGADAHPLDYRALSVASGFATVVLAWAIGRRTSTAVGMVSALLMCVSFPLVNYSGEARGYAPMVAAALGAYLAAEMWLEKPSQGRAATLIAVSLLGLMSHLTFIVVQGAIGLYLLLEICGQTRSVVKTVARLVPLFGAQIIYLITFASIAVNNMVVGGDSNVPPLESLVLLIFSVSGIDVFDQPIAVANKMLIPLGIALALIPATGLALVAAQGRKNEWIVPGVVIFVFPILYVLLLTGVPGIGPAPRYFLVCAPFALLLLARLTVWAGGRGAWVRASAILVISLCLLGNINLLVKFFASGRGDYAGAVREIAAASEGQTRVATYHALRGGIQFDYHSRRLGLDKKLNTVPPEEDESDPAEWYIDGRVRVGTPPSQLSRPVGSNPPVVYDLFLVVPYWGLSGDPWAVYRRRE